MNELNTQVLMYTLSSDYLSLFRYKGGPKK